MLGVKINYDKRIYGYDLLRAFAISCVVHGHGRLLLSGTRLELFPWIKLPHGVDIFFVLSGFLIGYSFIVNASKGTTADLVGKTINFWKRSALRILPNYYLLLFINYLLIQGGFLNGSTENFGLIRFATFTQNLFYPFYGFYWESWSLATQEWFYLLFPLLLTLFTLKLDFKKSILIVVILFIITSISYRLIINNDSYDSFWWDVSFRKVVASRIDCIFFGVLAAWIRFYYNKFWKKYAVHSFVAGIIMFLLISYIPNEINSIYRNVIYLTLAPIYISLWFPCIDRLKDVKTVIGKLITVVSIISYGMYLLNLLLIQLINNHLSEWLKNNTTLKYLIYWLLVLVFSYLLYILYENPISTYGNKLLQTTKMMYKRIGANKE